MDAVGLNPTFAEPDGVVDVNLAPLHAILIPRLEVVLLSLLDAMFVDFQPVLWTVPERLSSPALPAGARFGWAPLQRAEESIRLEGNTLVFRGDLASLDVGCKEAADCACEPGVDEGCLRNDLVCDSQLCVPPVASDE
jgi:hypothetical protein